MKLGKGIFWYLTLLAPNLLLCNDVSTGNRFIVLIQLETLEHRPTYYPSKGNIQFHLHSTTVTQYSGLVSKAVDLGMVELHNSFGNLMTLIPQQISLYIT